MKIQVTHEGIGYAFLHILPLAFIIAYIGFHDWGGNLVSPYRFSDSELYLHHAWYLAFIDASGGTMGQVTPPSPYVLILTGFYKLFGPALIVPYLANAALYTGSVLFLSHFTGNMFDRKTGILAGFILALSGPFVFFTGLTMKVAGMVFFLCAVLYFLERAYTTCKLTPLIFFSVFFSLLALERNNFLIFLPAAIMLAPFKSTSVKQAVFRTMSVILTVTLTSVAIMHPFSGAHHTSPLGSNFYIGNSRIATGAYAVIPGIRNDIIGHHTDIYDVGISPNEQRLNTETPTRAEWYWIKKTLDDIADYPWQWIKLMIRKTAMMFSAYSPDVPNQYPIWRWQNPFLSAAVFDYGLILALALPGMVLAWRQSQLARMIIFTFPAYAATVIIFFVVERYRIPLMVAITPFAAYSITGLLNVTARKTKAMAISGILTLYLITHLLNYVNPIGPGWRDNPEGIRSVLEKQRQEIFHVHILKQQAIRENSPTTWRELATWYSRYGMRSDSRTFIRKSNISSGQ